VGIPGREITFTFDRLNNLKKGAAVHLAGVHVGKVTRIELLEDGNGARVTAQINAPVTLRDGVTAELGSLGMIGEAYISLVNGPAARPEFDWTTPIHGTAGTELSALIAKVDAALNQTTEVVALAKELLATTQEELRETAKALRQATGDTTRGLDTFVAKMDPVLTRTARLVDVLERRLPPLLTSAEGVVANADKQVSAIGNDAHGLAADAKSWLAETQTDTTRLMDDVRDVVEESRQTLSTLTDEAKRLRADLSQVAIRTNETIGDEKTRLNETLSRLDAGVEQAKALVKRLDAVTAKIESGDGTLATLIAKQDTLVPRVEAVLDETTTAFQRFNAITEPVQQLTSACELGVRTHLPTDRRRASERTRRRTPTRRAARTARVHHEPGRTTALQRRRLGTVGVVCRTGRIHRVARGARRRLERAPEPDASGRSGRHFPSALPR
jgi:phospholipid/cholesterol/gamma-HCH transport system substrate-binding protein